MEEKMTYLAAGDKLIKNQEGFFIHYDGQEVPVAITPEKGIELLFETCEGLRKALENILQK